jgi:hypothetical protein
MCTSSTAGRAHHALPGFFQSSSTAKIGIGLLELQNVIYRYNVRPDPSRPKHLLVGHPGVCHRQRDAAESLVPTVSHRPSVGQYTEQQWRARAATVCGNGAVPLTDAAACEEPFGRPGLPIAKCSFAAGAASVVDCASIFISTIRYAAIAGCYVAHFDFDENTVFSLQQTRRGAE